MPVMVACLAALYRKNAAKQGGTEPPWPSAKQAAYDPSVKVGAMCAEARPPPGTAPEQRISVQGTMCQTNRAEPFQRLNLLYFYLFGNLFNAGGNIVEGSGHGGLNLGNPTFLCGTPLFLKHSGKPR